MFKKLLLLLGTVTLAGIGFMYFDDYLFYHQYYFEFMESWKNWLLLGGGLIATIIPTVVLLHSKKVNFWSFLASLVIGLYVFSVGAVITKGNMYGFAAYIKLLINVILIGGLWIYTLIAFTTVGSLLKEKLLGLHTKNIFGVILNMGIGLVVFLCLLYVLIVTKLLFSWLSRGVLFYVGWLMYTHREALHEYWNYLLDARSEFLMSNHHGWIGLLSILFAPHVLGLFAGGNGAGAVFLGIIGLCFIGYYVYRSFQKNDLGFDGITWKQVIAFFLIVLSIRYIYNGFVLAFIPYPTAWDANHAYMFYPKMWALNNGFYRDPDGMGGTPHFWYGYIAYWFSLFAPFGGVLGISTDTIAIEMNGLSGLFVLIFGVALVAEVTRYISTYRKSSHEDDSDASSSAIFLGWFMLLLWLMSGMGMFLVFIDNKTDLGVMALIILAMYSGFVFLKYKHDHEGKSSKHIYTYIGLSGFFYACATLAKPTALFDVLNFFLFLWGTWIGFLGTIGIVLLVIGVLLLLKFRGISDYLSTKSAPYLSIVGLTGIIGNFFTSKISALRSYFMYFLVRGGIFLATIVVFKAPFMIGKSIAGLRDYTPKSFVQQLLLGNNTPKYSPMLAQAGSEDLAATCSLTSEGLNDSSELYDGLIENIGSTYNEDVGRYVGFGWKGNESDLKRNIAPYTNPWRGVFLSEGCYGFNPFFQSTRDAKLLCENRSALLEGDEQTLEMLTSSISDGSRASELLDEVYTYRQENTELSPVEFQNNVSLQLRELDQIAQGNTIYVVNSDYGKEVFVPYRFLTFFNITFNRSLQNLSSYYTDIGVVWLIAILLTIVSTIYAIFTRKKILLSLGMVTLIGWFLWMLIGGGILWYAIGIIAWTIVTISIFVYSLIEDADKHGHKYKILTNSAIFIFVMICIVQTLLNMIRIVTQGGQGPFMRYKANVGVVHMLNERLEVDSSPQTGFGADDLFNLQFPHYKKMINLANQREGDEGVLIAGTYLRYFVNNQHNVQYDQFLTWLRKNLSDNNVCRTYLRLKDQNIRYIVIDPNIGTVVQGDGNKSLFDRFFGQVSSDNKILADGSLTMLAKLYQAGHVRYISSNSLGAKYAFILPDQAFGDMSPDAIALMRARMAVAKFFSSSPQLIQTIVGVAKQRVADGTFVTDLADAFGLQVRENVIVPLARADVTTLNEQQISELTNDERRALSQYLGLKNMDDAQLNQVLTQVVTQTLNAGNQMIALEVVQ